MGAVILLEVMLLAVLVVQVVDQPMELVWVMLLVRQVKVTLEVTHIMLLLVVAVVAVAKTPLVWMLLLQKQVMVAMG